MPAAVGYIRQFQPEDAGACCRLICSCLKADNSIPPDVREALIRAELPASMCERANLFYVAVYVLGDRIAGVAGVDMNEIRLLYVDPDCRRRGVGSLLLRHLEGMIPPALFADAFVYSAPGAIDFYRALGYRHGGAHAFRVGCVTVTTIFMNKQLGE